MITIGVTGGIACGKSTVAGFLEEWGVPVCDADVLAHDLMAPGMPAYETVVRHFGGSILAGDGAIDRRRLGAIVFADAAERQALNRMVHPFVVEGWRVWIRALEGHHKGAVAVLVPLLFEAGEGEGWTAVVCVSALHRTQVARMKARGWTEMEAEQRIAAQMPLREKEFRCEYVIMNEGSFEMLRRQTQNVLRSITERSTW